MLEEKKFVLYTANDSMEKRWFIRFKDENGAWKKDYGGINYGKTPLERHRLAQELINKKYQQTASQPRWCSECLKVLELNAGRLEPTSVHTYKYAVMSLSNYVGPELSQQSCEDFLHSLNPNTALSYKTAFVYVFKKARINIVLDKIEIKRQPHEPARFFEPDKAKEVLKYMDELGYYELSMLCRIQYFCYLRPKEILLVKKNDYDIASLKLLVSASVAKNDKRQYARIPAAFAKDLDIFLKSQAVLWPKSRATYNKQHSRVLSDLGLKGQGYKLYSWKHTGAVAYVKRGGSVKHLQILMRHSTIGMTDKYLRQMGIDDIENTFDIMVNL